MFVLNTSNYCIHREFIYNEEKFLVQFQRIEPGLCVFDASFNNILVAISFIDGRIRSTRREPLTCYILLANSIK